MMYVFSGIRNVFSCRLVGKFQMLFRLFQCVFNEIVLNIVTSCFPFFCFCFSEYASYLSTSTGFVFVFDFIIFRKSCLMLDNWPLLIFSADFTLVQDYDSRLEMQKIVK